MSRATTRQENVSQISYFCDMNGGGRRMDDMGLDVSTGGFSKDARYEADRASIPRAQMDVDELVRAVLRHISWASASASFDTVFKCRKQPLDISVLVATFNNADRLQESLWAMAECERPEGAAIEFVVVDNNSADHTKRVVLACQDRLPVRYSFEATQGVSAARNHGVRLARGRLLVFADDDITPSRTWITSYWRAFQETPTGWFWGGPITSKFEGNPPSMSLLKVAPASVKGLDLGGEELDLPSDEVCLVGANWACPAEMVRAAGGFSEKLGLNAGTFNPQVGEETDLMRRLLELGSKARYLPGARVGHFVPRRKATLRHLAERRRAYGRYRALQDHHRTAAVLQMPAWVAGRLLSSALRCALALLQLRTDRATLEYLRFHEALGMARQYRRAGSPVGAKEAPVAALAPDRGADDRRSAGS